jgi:hypothetical protein
MTRSSTADAKTTDKVALISLNVLMDNFRVASASCSGHRFIVAESKLARSITRGFLGLALTILTVRIGWRFSMRNVLIIGALISTTLRLPKY